MVRTKQTGKPNGKPRPKKSNPATPNADKVIKSPTQAAELSEAEQEKLKRWLNTKDKPFSVTTAHPSKKRKRDDGEFQLTNELWEDRLAVRYKLNPRKEWESLRRFKRFTVGNESIGTGQCILVKHDNSESTRIDIEAQWKAKVLEIRALDSEHVYIHVAWLNRPEDLKTGRQPYHGRHELIPTNQMDVIDAMAVNGSVEVVHWDETDDDSFLTNDDDFFWRQTYDQANTRTFSKLRKICIDDAPQNPDEMILQCGNADCRKWMHVKCIAQRAVLDASSPKSASKAREPLLKQERDYDKSVIAKEEKQGYTAEIVVKGLPDGEGQHPADVTMMIITDERGEKSRQHIDCLFCHQDIE